MSRNSSKLIYGNHNITSPFGDRIHPITGKKSKHLGTDYGTGGKKIPCYAIEDGVVRLATKGSGQGNYVFVEYPRLGYVGDYQHLDSISVKVGQKVQKGTQIGIIGTTGDSTGIHLHFGIFPTSDLNKGWYDKRWVDYEKFDLKEIIEPTTEDKNIDQLQVMSDNTMRVRENPNGTIIGLSKKGFYNVLETQENGDYIWCKIADNQWIAIDEPYSKYIYKYVEPKEEPTLEEDILNEMDKVPEYYERKEKENALLWLLQSILSFLKKIFNIK